MPPPPCLPATATIHCCSPTTTCSLLRRLPATTTTPVFCPTLHTDATAAITVPAIPFHVGVILCLPPPPWMTTFVLLPLYRLFVCHIRGFVIPRHCLPLHATTAATCCEPAVLRRTRTRRHRHRFHCLHLRSPAFLDATATPSATAEQLPYRSGVAAVL